METWSRISNRSQVVLTEVDHISSWDKAVAVFFGQKDQESRKRHMREKDKKKGLKVRFGTLTSEVDNAGDDNDRSSY